jgi:O-antigen ligase
MISILTGRSRLAQVALIATLLTPILLMHGHAIADGLIGIVDVCFLTHCFSTRDWGWLRKTWVPPAAIWWGWLVICSLPFPALHLGEGGVGPLVQALLVVRFLLFVAALEHFVLRDAGARRWLWGVLAISAVWIAGSSLIQFLFGRNLFGFPPGGDGELTGPFGMPRAAPPLSRILLPVLLPVAAVLLAGRNRVRRFGAYALLLAGVGIMVLIGQRMPLLLTLLGFLIAGLLLRQFRVAIVLAIVAGAMLIAASAAVSPPTYYRLVDKFTAQMEHFASSPYGQLYARAYEIGRQNPVTGRGYDTFRHFCPEPRYFRPTFDGRQPDGGGAGICAQHPHNFYLQAFIESGLPGLALFCALGVAWLWPLACRLWRDPDPLRVGLFTAIVIQLWPLASTSAFTSMPMGGWFFLLLGYAQAEARWRVPSSSPA